MGMFQYVGEGEIDTIVTSVRELERIAQNKHSRAYGMSR